MKRILVGAVMLGLAFTTGCDSTAAPSPTYLCVPEAGGDAVPCDATDFEAAQRRDALYAEAEAVYRRLWAEMARVDSDPAPHMTTELEAVTAGPYRETLVQLLVAMRGNQRLSGDSSLVWVRRLIGLERSGSVVALHVCTDDRQALFANPAGGDPLRGRAVDRLIYLARADGVGALRIVDSEFARVEAC